MTEAGCTFLASALNRSRLRELDLSYNHPGDLGLQLLSALRDDPQCSLQKLRWVVTSSTRAAGINQSANNDIMGEQSLYKTNVPYGTIQYIESDLKI